jgi:hypothetical protein
VDARLEPSPPPRILTPADTPTSGKHLSALAGDRAPPPTLRKSAPTMLAEFTMQVLCIAQAALRLTSFGPRIVVPR